MRKTILAFIAALLLPAFGVAAADGIGMDTPPRQAATEEATVMPLTSRQSAMKYFITAMSGDISGERSVTLLLDALDADPSYRAPLGALMKFRSRKELVKVIAPALLKHAGRCPENLLLNCVAATFAAADGVSPELIGELAARAMRAAGDPWMLAPRDASLYSMLAAELAQKAVGQKDNFSDFPVDAAALPEGRLTPQQQSIVLSGLRYYYFAAQKADDSRRFLWLLPSEKSRFLAQKKLFLTKLAAEDAESGNRKSLQNHMRNYMAMKEYDYADRAADRLLQLDAGDVSAQITRCDIKFARKDYDGAGKLIAAMPDGLLRDMMYSRLHMVRKNYPEMRKSFLALEKKLGKRMPPVHYVNALLAAEKLRDTVLLEHCWRALEQRKALKDPQFANSVGYVATELNVRLPEAEKLIAYALNKDPKNPAYLDSMAWVMYRQGRYPESEKYIREALSYDFPSDDDNEKGVLFAHAGEIMLKTRPAEAADWFRRALATGSSEIDRDKIAAELKKLEKK